MRIALLTENSLPAAHCAGALSADYVLCGILMRTAFPPLPFATTHALDDEQAAFETDAWFGGKPPALSDFAPVSPVADMTGADAAAALRRMTPDVVVALNAGGIGQPVIDTVDGRAVVLHAGDPQDYRGEDTHLWAVYHGEEDRLECVVQYAAAEVNMGAVLAGTPPDMPPSLSLYGLRKAVTDGCIDGALKILKFFDGGGMLTVTRLQRLGKVYTPMPAVVKDYCVERFVRRRAGGADQGH